MYSVTGLWVDWTQTGRLLFSGHRLIVPRAGILWGLEAIGVEGRPKVLGSFFLKCIPFYFTGPRKAGLASCWTL